MSSSSPARYKPSRMFRCESPNTDAARNGAERSEAIVAIERLMPGLRGVQRRPLSATDRALSGNGVAWMLALPAQARPKALSEQFPRIVDHLAEHWYDLPNTRLALMRLLADERGGRQGFSLQIEQEIGRLAAYVQVLLDVAPTEPAGL
jgi:hypothetical protein